VRKRPQPPSRIKYAKAHPVIGVHLTLDERELLRTLSQKSGLSPTTIVKQALGILDTDMEVVRQHALQEGIAKGKRTGRIEGRREGYAEALSQYQIPYLCSRCGGTIVLRAGSESAAAAARMLGEAGWRHAECQSGPLPGAPPRAR